jgi:hypothetical protein
MVVLYTTGDPLFREKGGGGGGGDGGGGGGDGGGGGGDGGDGRRDIFVVHGTYRVNDLLGNAGHDNDDDDDNYRCGLSFFFCWC